MKRLLPLLLAALLLAGCASPAPAPAEPETLPDTRQETLPPPTQPEATAPQPPVVTKDPTDEHLAPGGKTWFVAHARDAAILTWEFVSPQGTVYSVTDAMSLNPGLELDISGEDTVELSNVPLSLNGWSARARFDGPGGSATSAPARITVAQSQGAYDAVIEKYRRAMSRIGEGEGAVYACDVSEMLLYCDHVGYATSDLDGDGTPELLIGGIGNRLSDAPCLFELFTLRDGVPVSVARSGVREQLYLMEDGRLYLEGSSGAASDCYSVMQYAGGTVRFLTGLYTSALRPDGTAGDVSYYYTTGNQYGDPARMAGDSPMQEKVALTFVDTWRSSLRLPDLCLIA